MIPVLRNKNIKLVIVSILVITIGFALFQSYQKNAIASVPDSFCICAGEKSEIKSADGKNDHYDLQTVEIEHNKKTYHIYASEQYLSSNGAYVYVTGSYWDSILKPNVFVNGQKVKVRRTGYDYYHFYIYNVIPDYKYEINVYCGEKSDFINVFFHCE